MSRRAICQRRCSSAWSTMSCGCPGKKVYLQPSSGQITFGKELPTTSVDSNFSPKSEVYAVNLYTSLPHSCLCREAIGIYIKTFRMFLSIIFKLLKMGYQITPIVITLRTTGTCYIKTSHLVAHAAGKGRKLQKTGP